MVWVLLLKWTVSMWRLFRRGDGVEVGTVSMALRRADRLFRLDKLGMVVSCGGVWWSWV